MADFLCNEDEQLAQGLYLLGYFDNFIGADHANIVHHAVIVIGLADNTDSAKAHRALLRTPSTNGPLSTYILMTPKYPRKKFAIAPNIYYNIYSICGKHLFA